MPFQKGHKLAKGGKRPGSGRRPLKVRELCEKTFAERILLLAKFADDATLEPRDRIAALKLLSVVGVPERKEVTGPEGGPLVVQFVGKAEQWSR